MLCYVNIYHKNFLFGGLLKVIVLYCIVLYCIVLYCIVLYCIVLYCIVLYCIVLYCIVLYCIVLYCIVLYCIVLNILYNAYYEIITMHAYHQRKESQYESNFINIIALS